MIKGIFFDVGGTLYTYKNVKATTMETLQALKERLKLEHEFEEVARIYGEANKEVDVLMADKPFYLFRDYFVDIHNAFLRRVGKEHARDVQAWFTQYQNDKIMACMEIKPDCHDALSKIKDMGLYLSAVSNADDDMLEYLIQNERLDRWLTHWTASEAARSCKPDTGFYHVALKKAGLTPDQVLFVGDSMEQDVLGAQRVGIKTVLIHDVGWDAMATGRDVRPPDYKISNLSELPAIVEKLI